MAGGIEMTDERYSRQVAAFDVEGQRKIEEARVGIVGLGGLGSHVAQGLSYLGVRSIVLVDDDHVDTSNLNRLVGARPLDATEMAPKVDVAKRHITFINPGADVQKVHQNLLSRGALEALKACSVIFGCVDHDAPRLVLSEFAAAYELTLVDSATEINVSGQQIVDLGGRVVVAHAHDFCLDCAQEIDMATAKEELFSPPTRELRRKLGYGAGQDVPAPAVVSLNGVVANLAVTEFLMMITGIRAPYRHLVYHGLRGRVNVRTAERRRDCYICGYVAGKGTASMVERYVSGM